MDSAHHGSAERLAGRIRWPRRGLAQAVALVAVALGGLAGGNALADLAGEAVAPFGLRFGLTRAEVDLPAVEPLDFFTDSYGCLAQVTALYDRGTIAHSATWPLSRESPAKLGSVIRSIRANLDQVAGLDAFYADIPYAGRTRRVCLSFHEDRLYLVAIRGDEVADILLALERRIDARDHELEVRCDGPRCGRKWLNDRRDVLIELKTYGDAGASGPMADWALRQSWLTYTYIPVKVEQTKAMVAVYDKLLGDTPAKKAQRERAWLRQIQRSLDESRDARLKKAR